MRQMIKFSPLPPYAEHTPLPEFIEDCVARNITNDDGHGFYATETEVSNIQIDCTHLFKRNFNTQYDWTHVVWFMR